MSNFGFIWRCKSWSVGGWSHVGSGPLWRAYRLRLGCHLWRLSRQSEHGNDRDLAQRTRERNDWTNVRVVGKLLLAKCLASMARRRCQLDHQRAKFVGWLAGVGLCDPVCELEAGARNIEKVCHGGCRCKHGRIHCVGPGSGWKPWQSSDVRVRFGLNPRRFSPTRLPWHVIDRWRIRLERQHRFGRESVPANCGFTRRHNRWRVHCESLAGEVGAGAGGPHGKSVRKLATD